MNDKIVLGRCLGMESMVMGCAGGRRAVSSSGGRVVVTGLGTVRADIGGELKLSDNCKILEET